MKPPVTVTPPPAVMPSAVPEAAGRWRGRPAARTSTGTQREAAVADAASPAADPAALTAGGCCAWPLSLDATCAGAGRRMFRQAASSLGLPDEAIADGMTMASELAANTLYAQQNVQFDGAAPLPVAGAPEMWLYLRCAAGRWELVCTAFDSLAGWKDGIQPDPGRVQPFAESGHGLQIVAGLSGGRWGHHLSRSRLGSWPVPGKAVWFAQPLPPGRVPARLQRARPLPCQVSRRLEEMLAERGLGETLLRAGEAGTGISVLSVRRGLNVWCLPGAIMWRTGAGGYEQRPLTDLEDTAESLVSLCEELGSSPAAEAYPARPGASLSGLRS
jgi:hypothetical protein